MRNLVADGQPPLPGLAIRRDEDGPVGDATVVEVNVLRGRRHVEPADPRDVSDWTRELSQECIGRRQSLDQLFRSLVRVLPDLVP
jgi:hypothetical protein